MLGFGSKRQYIPLIKEDTFLSEKEMDRLLVKERVRCDRYGHYFSLIVIQLANESVVSSQTSIRSLSHFLDRRLRITDDKGYLTKGGLGILLPMTPLAGAQVVQRDISSFAELSGIDLSSQIYTYEGHDGREPDSTLDLNGESVDDSSMLNDSTNPPDGNSVDFGGESIVTIESKPVLVRTAGPIRADGNTQTSVIDNSLIRIEEYCSRPFPIWKRSIDIVGASIGLVVSAPIIFAAAIAIKSTSKGPILFRQMRSGQFGKPFAIYKLRTMVVDAEELKHLLHERNERDGPAFKMKHDPRVTRVGRFLRKVGVDELPQLVNVLVGEMSIVGPRPLPVCEDAQCASWQRRRLDTKPGLTCTWQISKSRKISFRDWMRLDLQYSKQRSPITDFKLMLKTIGAVFLGRVGH